MNNTDNLLQQLLQKVNENSTKPGLILQGITLSLLVLKPVFMYYIQAKFKAPPPHEQCLRSVDDNKEEQQTPRRPDAIKTFQLDP